MIRTTFRFLGIWLLAAAVVAAVIDGTRTIAEGRLIVTPLGQTWFQLNAVSLNFVQAWIERTLNPRLWDPVLTTVLAAPTAAAVFAVSLLCLVLGRPKRDIFG